MKNQTVYIKSLSGDRYELEVQELQTIGEMKNLLLEEIKNRKGNCEKEGLPFREKGFSEKTTVENLKIISGGRSLADVQPISSSGLLSGGGYLRIQSQQCAESATETSTLSLNENAESNEQELYEVAKKNCAFFKDFVEGKIKEKDVELVWVVQRVTQNKVTASATVQLKPYPNNQYCTLDYCFFDITDSDDSEKSQVTIPNKGIDRALKYSKLYQKKQGEFPENDRASCRLQAVLVPKVLSNYNVTKSSLQQPTKLKDYLLESEKDSCNYQLLNKNNNTKELGKYLPFVTLGYLDQDDPEYHLPYYPKVVNEIFNKKLTQIQKRLEEDWSSVNQGNFFTINFTDIQRCEQEKEKIHATIQYLKKRLKNILP